ncbi:MAG: cation:proton antiporter [Spirochaetales bacterium]|nr:cation:proton antiporter [Spirochaetales bacterium]
MEHELALNIFVIIGFLAIAVASSVLLKKLHFPYTIGLVVVGFALGILAIQVAYEPLVSLSLTPDTILYLILPTLIYDASINMDLKALQKNIVPILLLAVVGVLISTGIIGGVLSLSATLGIGSALLFGALISATDPVAVISLFNEIGAPRQLVTLVDGESIFNDATAIVLFSIILSALNSGISTVGTLVFNSVISFLIVLLGGLLIGSAVGLIGGFIVRLQRNNVPLQITVSLIMAYISFITADLLHVSGVMSTLAAGIVVSLLSNDVLKHENHYFMENFWDYFSFVANSFVFLLLGLTEAQNFSDSSGLITSLKLMLLVIPAVTVARAAVIYLIIPLYNRFERGIKISPAFQAILFWGGLRGAVPVALVLAIPAGFPGKDVIVHITLGYILFTLLVQGTTVKKLMDKLNVKAEKSYFDYHKGVSYKVKFPTVRLVELVASQVIGSFKDEGFFVTDSETQPGRSFLMSRGQKYLGVDLKGSVMKVSASNQDDLAYGRQTVYETLVELDNSVSSLEELVKSPEMREIVKEDAADFKTTLNIAKYLRKDLITLDLKSREKNAVIKELVDLVADAGAIENREMVLEAVLEREASMSTGFENGIAIPHAKCDASDNIVMAVGIDREGIDFDSLDKKPTRLFFLIISPKSHVGPHIQLLAEIGRKMNNPELREKIMNADNSDTVFQLLGQK